MSFWDMFKPKQPTRQPLPEIKLHHTDGTIYFLRARNTYTGFDDVLQFDEPIHRQHYIELARTSTPCPNDWYFDQWETTKESRLQESLEAQRTALEQSYITDINALKFQLSKINGKYKELQEQFERVKQEQSAPTPAPPAQDTRADLIDLQKQFVHVLTCIDTSKLDSIKQQYERELKQVSARMPLQGKLVMAMLQRYINTH